MDKNMVERIKRQVSLKEKPKTGNWENLQNSHNNVWGNALGISGNLTGISGLAEDIINILSS